MFTKIGTITFFAIVTASSGAVWDGFSASWDRDPTKNFYNLPQTLAAAIAEGWTDISGVNPPRGIRALGYYNDPTLVLLFDCKSAVGFQYAFPVAVVENLPQPVNYEAHRSVTRKTLNGIPCYTSTVYFNNDDSNGIRNIRIQEYDGFLEIPTTEELLPLQTRYARKNCLPGMGNHYYNMFQNSSCVEQDLFFFLGRQGHIIGVGFQTFADVSKPLGIRTWWENIPPGGIVYAAPDAPTCAIEAIKEWGAVSLHVWFVSHPETITCS